MKKWALGVLLVAISAFTFSLFAQSDPETEVFNLINAYRSNSNVCFDGTTPVGWSGNQQQLVRSQTLDVAAQNHTRTMSESNCFAHQCPGEPGPLNRIAQANHQGWSWAAENILVDTLSADMALFEWQNSDAHNAILLACRARSIGIAKIQGWWTAVFTDAISQQPAPPPDNRSECFALDANHNNLIDDDEIQAAIQMWASASSICP